MLGLSFSLWNVGQVLGSSQTKPSSPITQMDYTKFAPNWPDSHPHHDKVAKGKTTESSGTYISLFYTTHYDQNPKTVTFEAAIHGIETLTLSVDFTGTVNMALTSEFKESTDSMKINALIRPFRRVYLGYMQVVDRYKSSSPSWSYSAKFEPDHPDDIEVCLNEFRQTLQHEIRRIDENHISLHSLEQDRMSQRGRNELIAANAKFIDFDFMPNDDALYKPISKRKMQGDPNAKKPWVVQWKRPADFMIDPERIRVFLGSISANDIKQGQLGDCWFLSTLAALTEFPNLIKDLFLDDFVRGVVTEQGRKAGYSPVGLYHLRFYKGGLKTNIRVDDYFPCLPGPKIVDRYGPIFSKSNGDELWVLLAEKAFAKVHGSYEALDAGEPHEAMMDLTGAPTKKISMNDADIKTKIASGEFWNLLKAYDEEKYLLITWTSSSSGEQREVVNKATGLVSNHAYTLLACIEVKGIKLCRLRNPWGAKEWTGDWSDSSPLWTDEMKDALRETIELMNSDQHPTPLTSTQSIMSTTNYEEIFNAENKNDGLFWMSYDDFIKYFAAISVCMVRHPRYSLHPWQVARKQVFFALDPTDHHVIHRCFRLVVTAPSADFVFALHQQDKRCQDAKAYIDIGVAIVKASTSATKKYEFVAGNKFKMVRENQTEVVHLETGEYFIVPMTTGGQLLNHYNVEVVNESTNADEGSDRLLDVPVTDRPITELTAYEDISFSKYVIRAYMELFESLNSNADGYLDKKEIDSFTVRLTGQSIPDAAYQALLQMFEDPKNHDKGLSIDGYLKYQLYQFHSSGCDEDRVAKELLDMGFDRKLRFRAGRSVALTVHATEGHADPAIPRPAGASASKHKNKHCSECAHNNTENEDEQYSSGKHAAPKLFTIQAIPYDPVLVKAAHTALVVALGKATSYDSGKYKVHVCDLGYDGASIAVENCQNQSLKVKMEFPESNCINVVSFRGSIAPHEESIPAHETRLYQHFTPKDTNESWNWHYSWTYWWGK